MLSVFRSERQEEGREEGRGGERWGGVEGRGRGGVFSRLSIFDGEADIREFWQRPGRTRKRRTPTASREKRLSSGKFSRHVSCCTEHAGVKLWPRDGSARGNQVRSTALSSPHLTRRRSRDRGVHRLLAPPHRNRLGRRGGHFESGVIFCSPPSHVEDAGIVVVVVAPVDVDGKR